MNDKAVLIHIGYPKTATTWMQRWLFTPENEFQSLCTHQDVFDYIVRPHSLNFDLDQGKLFFNQAMNKLHKNTIPVVSSEILAGHPFYGGRESDVFANRLAAMFPNAKILISIRKQSKIISSVYMQYLLRGGTMSHQQFFDGTDTIGYFGFDAKYFEYHRLIKYYQTLFGVDRVYVMNQEGLIQNIEDTAARISIFAENERYNGLSLDAKRRQGESYPQYAAPLLRRVNHIQSSVLNTSPIIELGRTPLGLYKIAGFVLKTNLLKLLFSNKQIIDSYVENKFQGLFTDSNVALERIVKYPIDLSGYEGIHDSVAREG